MPAESQNFALFLNLILDASFYSLYGICLFGECRTNADYYCHGYCKKHRNTSTTTPDSAIVERKKEPAQTIFIFHPFYKRNLRYRERERHCVDLFRVLLRDDLL